MRICWGKGACKAARGCQVGGGWRWQGGDGEVKMARGRDGEGEIWELKMARWSKRGGDREVDMGRWRWQGGDGKVEIARWRLQGGDGKVEIASWR